MSTEILDENDDWQERFRKALENCERLGLIGVGAFGPRLQQLARDQQVETLLCDPPRSLDESEEIGDEFFALWGNGMGGCEMKREGTESFLPMSTLACRCDVIAVQVPLNETTRGMIDTPFMESCQKDVTILCFSDPEVLDKDVRTAPGA